MMFSLPKLDWFELIKRLSQTIKTRRLSSSKKIGFLNYTKYTYSGLCLGIFVFKKRIFEIDYRL